MQEVTFEMIEKLVKAKKRYIKRSHEVTGVRDTYPLVNFLSVDRLREAAAAVGVETVTEPHDSTTFIEFFYYKGVRFYYLHDVSDWREPEDYGADR